MTKKYIILGGLVLGLVTALHTTYAEDGGTSAPMRPLSGAPQPARPMMDRATYEKMMAQKRAENPELRAKLQDEKKDIFEEHAQILEQRKTMQGIMQQGREDIQGLRDGMTKENRMEVKDMIKDKRAEMQGARQDMRDDIKEKRTEIKEKRKDAQEVRREILQNRFNAMVERLTTLGTRIDSRLTKIADSGKDVTELKTKLLDAQAKIADAQAKVSSIANSNGEGSNDSGMALGLNDEKKATLQEVKTLMKDAQNIFKEIISEIKVEPKKTTETNN